MKNLKVIAAMAILALPALAGDRGRGNGYGRGGRDYRGGVVVSPRPVYPAYPAPAYVDPFYGSYAMSAPFGPPAMMYDRPGPRPGPGFVWVNGFWRWGGARYVWAPGFWTRPPRPHANWVAGGWFGGPRGFSFRAGFWR